MYSNGGGGWHGLVLSREFVRAHVCVCAHFKVLYTQDCGSFFLRALSGSSRPCPLDLVLPFSPVWEVLVDAR